MRFTDDYYGETETGAIRKRWKGRIRVALVYPNHYPVGMSNLGFQAVYRLINTLDHVLCERAFLHDVHTGKPIRTIESGRALSEFHIIAFSVSFENDFPNLLAILRKAEIPLRAEDRRAPHPLVLAGGVACFLNPEPIAPFIDCFLMGEAEAILFDFFNVFEPGKDRTSALKGLALGIEGAYVPAFYRATYHSDGTLHTFTPNGNVPARIKRRYQNDLTATRTCSTVLTPGTTFKDTFLIEVARGCPHGCRFCSAGFIYRPPRFRSVAHLKACVDSAALVADKIGLVSTVVSDLPGLDEVCQTALDRGLDISFSSLRTDALTPEIVSILRKSRVKTATLAPDAGSERMRRVINKGITEDNVLDATELLVAGGIPNLKLYFMVGLPTESPDDVSAIIELCMRVKRRFLAASRARNRIGDITVSLNAFVPKPFTPFQWTAMDNLSVLKKKFRQVKDGLKRMANVNVKTGPLRGDYVQALFSRGDRRVADILIRHHQEGGPWPKTLRAVSPGPDFYVTRERPVNEKLPWDFIDHGIRKSFLAREYKKANQGRTSSPCPMKDCRECGICKST